MLPVGGIEDRPSGKRFCGRRDPTLNWYATMSEAPFIRSGCPHTDQSLPAYVLDEVGLIVVIRGAAGQLAQLHRLRAAVNRLDVVVLEPG